MVESKLNHLTYTALFSYCLFAFTSNAGLNLYHLFILIPGAYFTYKNFSWQNYSKASQFLFLYCAMATISIFPSDIVDKWDAFGALRYYLIALLAIAAFENYFSQKIDHVKKIRVLLNVILFSTTLANVSGLIGLYTEFNPLRFAPTTDKLRATGMYSLAITYGYGVQFFCVVVAYLALYRNHLKNYANRWLLLSGLVTSFAGLYFSFSRGALLGFLLGAPFLFLHKSKKLVKIFFVATFSLLLVLGVALYSTGGSKENRLFQKLGSDSNLIRIAQYKALWEGFKSSPMTGLGFTNFRNKATEIKKQHGIEFPEFGGHAHNNFAEALVSTGVLGAIPFLLFHLFWFLQSYRRQDLLGPLLCAFIVAMVVSGLLQNTMTDSENAFLLMLVFSLSQVKSFRT